MKHYVAILVFTYFDDDGNDVGGHTEKFQGAYPSSKKAASEFRGLAHRIEDADYEGKVEVRVAELFETQYTLHHTGNSSAKYGDCEICGKWVSDVYHQTAHINFVDSEGRDAESSIENAATVFGHENCLLQAREYFKV